MKTNLKFLAIAALSAWVIEAGHAGPVAPLTTFAAGTQAKASEVNGNFNAVKTAVDDNAGRIGALESGINFGVGSANTLLGAGNLTMTGSDNTASGRFAFVSNTTGGANTVSGYSALPSNTTGNYNNAYGMQSLQNNSSGSYNIALGTFAGYNLTTGSDNIDIGNMGGTGESGVIRIGTAGTHTAAFIAGIRGVTTVDANAVAVVIDSAGQLGTVSSSRRVKDDIADMGEASRALMKLRPVSFHYKADKNPKGRTLQYGLVAEEVAQVVPGLVARSADGKIETVYYQFLAPMLLNEYQKQQRTIEAQTTRIAQLEKQGVEVAGLKQQLTRMAVLLGRLEQTHTIATAARWQTVDRPNDLFSKENGRRVSCDSSNERAAREIVPN